jgi:hypothetical protein
MWFFLQNYPTYLTIDEIIVGIIDAISPAKALKYLLTICKICWDYWCDSSTNSTWSTWPFVRFVGITDVIPPPTAPEVPDQIEANTGGQTDASTSDEHKTEESNGELQNVNDVFWTSQSSVDKYYFIRTRVYPAQNSS